MRGEIHNNMELASSANFHPEQGKRTDEVERVFGPAIEETARFIKEHPEQVSALPKWMRSSFLKACAFLGILVAPGLAYGQSADVDTPDKPKIEMGTEMAFSGGAASKASVIGMEKEFRGVSLELGGKAVWGRSVFVPDNSLDITGNTAYKPPVEHKKLVGLEADAAATVKEAGPVEIKAISELSGCSNGAVWFFGGQGEVDLSHGLTAYANTGRYLDFSRSGGDHEPGYRAKLGLQADLKSSLAFLPEGTAYVEFGGAGRDKGFTIGFTRSLGKKSEKE